MTTKRPCVSVQITTEKLDLDDVDVVIGGQGESLRDMWRCGWSV
jgi:hypothetical protein